MFDYSSVLSKKVVDLKKSGIRKFFDLLNDPSMSDVVGLTVGQPDFVTPWHIREAGIESLQKGKTYYTCDKGAACGFRTWDIPTAELCPKCGKTLFRHFSSLHCVAEGCGYEAPYQKNTKTENKTK